MCGVRDPEGLLSTIPAIATTLIGVLAGGWLRESGRNGHVKAAALFIAGAIGLAMGCLWDQSFPINKNLWSSSFVLWTGGLSLILLGLFYLVIDVWGWKKWAFVFVVIGANAITIYVAQEWLNFDALGALLVRPCAHSPLAAVQRRAGGEMVLVVSPLPPTDLPAAVGARHPKRHRHPERTPSS